MIYLILVVKERILTKEIEYYIKNGGNIIVTHDHEYKRLKFWV